MQLEDNIYVALDKLATYLAQRDHAPIELRKKLRGKFEESTINQALGLATEKGWLKSPEELSESVTQTLHRKHKGFLYIQNYLKNLELPTTPMDESKEFEKCLSLLDNRFANWQNFTYEQKHKPIRFLQSRGFTLSTIKKVLNETK
ncbi:MAG: RecX family transcriptional regulator [Bdellovibrionaceae bacterium]|nr:RecX family transcriptional regulator [Pseudobdellovibrionaceae bacterium]